MRFLWLLPTLCLASNLLFTSVKRDVSNPVFLDVNGSLPEWLDGVLYRNGFGKFEGNGFQFNHLFDSLSFILRFNISNGAVSYTAKLLKSNYFVQSLFKIPEYRTLGGTTPDMNFNEKLKTILHSNHDNFNANIMRLGPHITAISDMLGNIIIDKNLDYNGKYPFEDGKLDLISSAHPSYLRGELGVHLNYKAIFFPFPRYSFYYVDTTKSEPYYRQQLINIYSEKLSYVHSFSETDNYIIFITYPLYWNIEKILSSTTILPTLEWHPEDKATLYIIDKFDKNIFRKYKLDAFFSFHHINAYQDGFALYFDLIAYRDASILEEFYLKNISNSSGFVGGYLRKYKIDMEIDHISYSEYNQYKLEMPVLNMKRKGLIYKYFYSICSKEEGMSICKVNRLDGSIIEWKQENHFPSEPIFVGNSKSEDDGVLLSVVLDENRGESYLLVLSSLTMDEMARVYLNMSVPMSCHGFFDKN